MGKKIFLRKALLTISGLMLITLFVFTGTIGWAKAPYQLPKVVYWGSSDVGAGLYAAAVSVSEKIGPALGIKFRIVPGTDIDRINMLISGKTHMNVMAADNYWASMGLAHYSTFALGPQPIRIVWAGWPSAGSGVGLATATSGIKTPYDLKGKRVAIIIGSAWNTEGARGTLAFANLSEKDVTILPVASSGASIKALTEGKADFTMQSNNAPGVYETETSPYGIYVVRYPHADKEGWKRFRNFLPYHVPGFATEGCGVKPGEKVETSIYAYPVINTFASQSDELVYAICKAIHQKMKEIVAALEDNKALMPERGIVPEVTLLAPYHNGAVKFFKEVGLWTKAHEDAQKRRLVQDEKVKRFWKEYTEEAQARMVSTGKKIDVAQEWREIVEKKVGMIP